MASLNLSQDVAIYLKEKKNTYSVVTVLLLTSTPLPGREPILFPYKQASLIKRDCIIILARVSYIIRRASNNSWNFVYSVFAVFFVVLGLCGVFWCTVFEALSSDKHLTFTSHFEVLHTHTLQLFDFFVLLLCTTYICLKYLNKQYIHRKRHHTQNFSYCCWLNDLDIGKSHFFLHLTAIFFNFCPLGVSLLTPPPNPTTLLSLCF